jgi:hypothetical protein
LQITILSVPLLPKSEQVSRSLFNQFAISTCSGLNAVRIPTGGDTKQYQMASIPGKRLCGSGDWLALA